MEKSDQYWVRGKCIGMGSFGTVSLAFNYSDGTTFAVKSVGLNQPKSMLDSLENQIDILRSLDSKYVVSYLCDSTDRGFRKLHMEYMPAGTLADVAGEIDELRIRSYTRRVVEALFYLHSVAGVVHSDVKGQNVLLGAAPGLAKLADFGSAARIDVSPDSTKSPIGGTPLWMAPEVVRGERATPESDVWSLGCTVIEMATGSHPWRCPDRSPSSSSSSPAMDQLFRIGYGDELRQFPSGLSKPGLDFLGKCLRRRPEERWTAEQLLQHPFLADVAAIASGIGESPRSTLDWVSFSVFDDEDEQSCDGDVMELGRERVRELGEINDGVFMDWDGNKGWEVVRSLEQEA